MRLDHIFHRFKRTTVRETRQPLEPRRGEAARGSSRSKLADYSRSFTPVTVVGDIRAAGRAREHARGREHVHSLESILRGDYGAGEPPVPIPNTEVKPCRADGTAA